MDKEVYENDSVPLKDTVVDDKSMVENIIPSIVTPGVASNDGLGGGLLGALVLAGVLGGRGFGNTGTGFTDPAVVVKDSEANIVNALKDGFMVSNTQRMAETLNLHNRLCESEKAAIEAKYEAKLETKEAVVKLMERIDHVAEETQEAMGDFRNDVDNKFCALDKFLEAKFCHIDKEELREEIKDLRRELSEVEQAKLVQDTITGVVRALTCDPCSGGIIPLIKK